MRTTALILLALVAAAGGLIVLACGVTDPALAPMGATIALLGPGEESWTYSCHDDSGLPIVCYDAWRDYLIAYCQIQLAAEPNGAVQGCLDQGGEIGDCALAVCEGQNYWVTYIEDESVIRAARSAIGAIPGACGYLNALISAFVLMPTGAGGGGSGSTGGTSGGALTGQPLNDVEVRFIAEGGELYKLSDVPGQVAPLANPYVTRTNERGQADVKYRVPLPSFCGFAKTYTLSADIGVSRAFQIIDFSVDSWSGAAGSDDDSTTDDDDDNDTDDDATS